MKTTLLILMVMASVAVAGDDDIRAPDFNNWTTESLKKIFLKPTHIS
jgi:O-succinylbenzoate synthase